MKVVIESVIPKNHPFPIVSWMIRLFTFSKYSHVRIMFPDKGFIFEVYFNKWRIRNRPDCDIDSKVIIKKELEVSEDHYIQMLNKVTSDNGKLTKGYFIQLFGAFLGKVLFLDGNLFRGCFTSNLCSQYIFDLLMSSKEIYNKSTTKWQDMYLFNYDSISQKQLNDFIEEL